MDTPDRASNHLPIYSPRDDLIERLLRLNGVFAKGPDQLSREELTTKTDAALVAAFRLQAKLFYEACSDELRPGDTQSGKNSEALHLASGVKIVDGKIIWRRFDA